MMFLNSFENLFTSTICYTKIRKKEGRWLKLNNIMTNLTIIKFANI